MGGADVWSSSKPRLREQPEIDELEEERRGRKLAAGAVGSFLVRRRSLYDWGPCGHRQGSGRRGCRQSHGPPELLQKGKAWLKLSGAYLESRVAPPTYTDTVPVERAYVQAAPEGWLWGSDWRHPTE